MAYRLLQTCGIAHQCEAAPQVYVPTPCAYRVLCFGKPIVLRLHQAQIRIVLNEARTKHL